MTWDDRTYCIVWGCDEQTEEAGTVCRTHEREGTIPHGYDCRCETCQMERARDTAEEPSR